MKRATELKRRTELRADPETTRAFEQRARTNSRPTRRAVSPASPEQRAFVQGHGCLICGATPVDPAHLISRAACPEGADRALAVVPICRAHHRLYDDGKLSLLEYLEPHHRHELAFAIERFGLISTLEFVTNQRWRPVEAS